MRIIAWVGGLAVATVAGASVVSALGAEAGHARPLAVSQLQTVETGSGLPLPDGLFPAKPSAAPTKVKSTTPAAPRAAPTGTVSRPTVVIRSTQQTLINRDRARYHLAALTWSSCLYNVARYEAAHLAAPGVSFQHYDGVARDLTCHLGRQVGENIGWYSGGINDSTL